MRFKLQRIAVRAVSTVEESVPLHALSTGAHSASVTRVAMYEVCGGEMCGSVDKSNAGMKTKCLGASRRR